MFTFVATATLLAATAIVPAVAGAPVLKAPAQGHIQVAFVLTEGATMIDFAGPWEVFGDVHVPERGATMEEQMPFELFTVGTAKKPTRISSGFTMIPDYSFADAPMPDVVVVGAQQGAPELSAWLKRVRAENRVVMSVCTGAFKLAQAGLFDGKRATTHHDFFDRFAERFPKVELVRSRRWVQADPLTFSAGGLTSGIDLALHVVALYFGDEVAQRTATYMEYESQSWRTGDVAVAEKR
ncbi:MAG TPA: DJ-1/PfpI family protein [Methylomirabilota bacterium]|jgi:transcriptional regulator GlxA family with amidase domain|nr:DJ-1/PfpI family protein [Methylomirabilota bacterium]